MFTHNIILREIFKKGFGGRQNKLADKMPKEYREGNSKKNLLKL